MSSGGMSPLSYSLRAQVINMKRMLWRVVQGWVLAGLLIAGTLSGVVWGGEAGSVTLHHQAAGLTATLTTQPSPPRAGENLLRVDLTNAEDQPLPHAQVRLIITQVRTMPGMHSDRPQEVEAISTHVEVYVGRVHLATPGRWEVIVKVVRPGHPATQAVFYLNVEPT
jgi:YtkA-like